MKKRLKKLKNFLRNRGINRNLLEVFHYYLPYRSKDGEALAPRQLTIELTFHCNLKCEMCPYALLEGRGKDLPDEKNRMKIEEWEKVIRGFADAGGKKLKITGGEPLLIKDCTSLFRTAAHCKLETTMLSNATIIDSDTARKIVESGLNHIIVSLDGPEDVHDRIRGKGMYRKTLEGLAALVVMKKELDSELPRIHGAFTLTATNQHRIAEFVRGLPRDVFDTVSVNRIFYTTEKRLNATKKLAGETSWIKQEDWLLPRELCEYDQEVVKEQLILAKDEAETRGISLVISPVFGAKRFEEQTAYNPPAFARQCFQPWIAFRADPQGNVYPCSISVKLGNFREKNINEIWNGKPFQKFRRLIRDKKILPMCSTCCILTRPEWNWLPLKKK